MTTEYSRLTIRVTSDMRKVMRKVAANYDMSMSEFILWAIADLLEELSNEAQPKAASKKVTK